ncbi:MAG TPA: nucleotidyltransferase family protein, partial [Bacillota bacterium]|nr:nucleotidyltransferase family protein [Bacillota bacterium]
TLKRSLEQGQSYPTASKEAYEKIGLTSKSFDLSKPNNILGFSYIQAIKNLHLPIQPLTIKRTKSDYHDDSIIGTIASATSIRKEMLEMSRITENVQHALPASTVRQLNEYRAKTTFWHTWEAYFQLLHYRVMMMNPEELRNIHGVIEGLEHRIKKTARSATSIQDWISAIKTKRYTWTRIQRIFVHILTNTTKQEIQHIINNYHIPYVRLLGMTKTGKSYLNSVKSNMDVPLISSLKHLHYPMMKLEEKASRAYYSILDPEARHEIWKQEIQPPIRL